MTVKIANKSLWSFILFLFNVLGVVLNICMYIHVFFKITKWIKLPFY